MKGVSALLSGFLGTGALKLTRIALSFGTAIVLARTLGPDGFGVYAWALAIATVLAIPSEVGLSTLLVRDVAKYDSTQDWGSIRSLIRRTTSVALAISLGVAVLGIAVVVLLTPSRLGVEGAHTFLWAFALIPFVALNRLRGAALRGLRLIIRSELPDQLLRPLLLFVLLLILSALNGYLTPSRAMSVNVFAVAVAFLVGAFMLSRALPPKAKPQEGDHRLPVRLTGFWALSLLAGTQVLNGNLDVIIVGALADADEVALLKVASQAAALVLLGSTAVNTVLDPYVSRLWYRGELETLQSLISVATFLMVIFAIPVAILFFLFGHVLLDVFFGREYVGAWAPLVVLAVGQSVNAALGPVGVLVKMAGFERDALRSLVVTLIGNGALCVLLVPRWGALGAALSTAAAFVIWRGWLCLIVHSKMGISSFPSGRPLMDQRFLRALVGESSN